MLPPTPEEVNENLLRYLGIACVCAVVVRLFGTRGPRMLHGLLFSSADQLALRGWKRLEHLNTCLDYGACTVVGVPFG